MTGSFVRFGPNEISINTVEGLHNIYGVNANTQKLSYYSTNDVFKGESSLTTVDPSIHAKKKRIVSSALSDSSVRAMEGIVLRNVEKFTEILGQTENPQAPSTNSQYSWSTPKNMTELADYLSFDIMGDKCFSSPFDMLDKPDDRYVLHVLPQGVNGLNMVRDKRS